MRVLVIGGGAAGLMASISAAKSGADVTIVEKNEKLGKKIYITGKGRCNVTNACESAEFLSNVSRNPRFMYSSFGAFNNVDMMDFLAANGLSIKVERGNRVFPSSDKASDVTKTLANAAKKYGVKVELNTKVKSLLVEDGKCIGAVARHNGQRCDFLADKVILATGGISYPATGSTGDGYKMASDLGIEVTKTYPSLVPIEATFAEGYKDEIGRSNSEGHEDATGRSNSEGYELSELAGLSLKNVTAKVLKGKKEIASEFGEMLFTHTGVSGPIIITISSIISGKYDINELQLFIDFKPALTLDELDKRLLREFDEAKNKEIKSVMRKLLPDSMTGPMLRYAGICEKQFVHEITKEQRGRIARSLKSFELKMKGLGGFNEAIITRGGIDVKEINPSTMESKKVPGLYFAGEIIDVDAFTGGFNLQLAWSTGYVAGKGATNE